MKFDIYINKDFHLPITISEDGFKDEPFRHYKAPFPLFSKMSKNEYYACWNSKHYPLGKGALYYCFYKQLGRVCDYYLTYYQFSEEERKKRDKLLKKILKSGLASGSSYESLQECATEEFANYFSNNVYSEYVDFMLSKWKEYIYKPLPWEMKLDDKENIQTKIIRL